MRMLLKRGVILAAAILIVTPSLADAFNPATHIYIADQVFPDCAHKVDLYYGSTAPDIANSVANPEKWPTAFDDTHHTFIDLRGFASTSIQKALANGWLTHNEEWGADYYAHIAYPDEDGTTPGYVIQKAELLLDLKPHPDLTLDFAHFAIEVAIDLLLKNEDPQLGGKLLIANWLRSWQDRHLLAKVLVWKKRRTDWLTLAISEMSFRNLVGQYAMALALPSSKDKEALVKLGVELAKERYGIEVTALEVSVILEAAIGLCENDYQAMIDYVVEQIEGNL
jgi:hypothetical protein